MYRIMEDMQACTGCGACNAICPTGAIRMVADGEGFLFPTIDASRCTECGACRRTCPVNRADAAGKSDAVASATADPEGRSAGSPDPETHACWAKTTSLRAESSSGGAFSTLALAVLENGGLVFGAAFESPTRVVHRAADTPVALASLRRSKYVQSETGSTFREVKAALGEGREVLFCGTPCQVAGLHAFLGGRPEDLITCDFVCSGVPSPLVWRLHVEEMEKKRKSAACEVSFRDKAKGWRAYRLRIGFADGSRYEMPAKRDAFFIGFGKELYNRLSCAECRFRTRHSAADVTLADYWDIWKSGDVPAFRDDRGISMVVTHTERGAQALRQSEPVLHRVRRTFSEAASGNPRMLSSRPVSPQRKDFFAALAAGVPYEQVRRKYMDNTSPVYHAKRWIRALLPADLLMRLRRGMNI